ncbi:MAG: ADP-forming succinate--CoA ligase subunit beta [Phycisphaerales bacterium]|nr:ADP-forming succinate--CoA ligase subunit beta [Phycisphaerales bacterium]
MKIHEYQARQLLSDAGVPVPAGGVIERAEQAAHAYRLVSGGPDGPLAVVKAQVHAGGRGKAGFVKLVRSAREAEDAAKFMLSNRMVSPQTPPEGLPVHKLLLAAGVDIAKEFYLAITTDRTSRRNLLIASAQGGVEIEHVAATNPDAIIKEPIHPLMGLQAHQARRIAYELGFTGKQVGQAVNVMQRLAGLFLARDCSLAEINPLVLTPPSPEFPEGRVLAIDAKFNFDDNALFRQPEIDALFDPTEENANELKAISHGLSYVQLEGNIGCLVNGAGLAMATMDIIKHAGGQPANFLDVGGGASEAAVTEGFRIILSDSAVKGVLVNIFGGIMRCDVIAQAVINAAKEVGFRVPLVVRLEGNRVAEGKALLQAARPELPTMQAADDLGDAARKVVAAVKSAR